MHSLARRYIKTAVLFLAIGLGLGMWMIVRREFADASPDPYLTTAHTHSILIGFVMMMILGVALWLFPRPRQADDRYRPVLAEIAYWLITVGTVARTGSEVLHGSNSVGAHVLPALIVLGAALQAGGLLVFFYTVWFRIRPAGSREREARGERF